MKKKHNFTEQDQSNQKKVYVRLNEIAKQRIQKVQQEQQNVKNDENIDPATGKPFFKPKIGRSPKGRKNEVKQGIGDHLYNYHKQIQEKHNKLKKDEDIKLQEMKRQQYQSAKVTDKIINQNKKSKLQEIFDVLDSDSDGYISSQKIDIQIINAEILEILSPLLYEMDEIQQNLDREEFVDAALRLFQTLNVNEKNMILQFKRVPKPVINYQYQACTFHPNVNEKSRQIYNKKFQYQINQIDESQSNTQTLIANRLNKQKLETQNKLKLMKEEKDKNELIGCTFYPHIQTSYQTNKHNFNPYIKQENEICDTFGVVNNQKNSEKIDDSVELNSQ